jgi:hypothetical protein
MKRPSKRTLLVVAGTMALGAGGATLGVAASGGSNPAKDLADALNKNEGTKLTETDIQEAMQSVMTTRLDEAVKAGRLTQAQADELLQRAKDAPKRRAEHEAARAARIAPVEKLLGLTADEIRQKLDGSTTLAKLAESKGVSRAKLLDALKEGIRAAAKLQGDTLTDEQVTQMAERLADGSGRPGRGDRHRGFHGHDGFGPGGFPPLGP